MVIAFCFALCLIGFYPGEMSPDAFSYLADAQNFSFAPVTPIFSLMWALLGEIIKGPFSMLLLQQMMLWGATTIFIDTWYKKFGNSKLLWIFIFIPFFPSIFKLSGILFKDVHFAFAYLLAFSIISRFVLLQDKKPSIFLKLIVLLVILYGTGCKYQSIYLLPLMMFYYFFGLFSLRLRTNFILATLVSFLLSLSIIQLNSTISGNQKQYGWQSIKLYDLLYISAQKDRPLFPEYILQDRRIDFNKLLNQMRVDIRSFDDVIHYCHTSICMRTNEEESRALMDEWSKVVSHYPFTYLKGRMLMIFKIIYAPIHRYQLPLFANENNNKILAGSVNKSLYNNFLTKSFWFYNKSFIWITPLLVCIPFLLFYLYISAKQLYRSYRPEALVVFIMNITGVFYSLVMMFTAVCFDFRYLFICHVLFHFSHPFAWVIIKQYVKQKGKK